MAHGVPRSRRPKKTPAARRRSKWAHDWYPYQDYVNVHDRHMNKLLAEQLVLRDRTLFEEIRGSDLHEVTLRGRVDCARGVIIAVRKRMEVRRGPHNRHEVRTVHYSYHAWLRGSKHQIVRYDNAHDYLPYHRHSFDLSTGQEVRVDFIDLSDWPTMDEVIREAVYLSRFIS